MPAANMKRVKEVAVQTDDELLHALLYEKLLETHMKRQEQKLKRKKVQMQSQMTSGSWMNFLGSSSKSKAR
jgi:hypothetical protein